MFMVIVIGSVIVVGIGCYLSLVFCWSRCGVIVLVLLLLVLVLLFVIVSVIAIVSVSCSGIVIVFVNVVCLVIAIVCDIFMVVVGFCMMYRYCSRYCF